MVDLSVTRLHRWHLHKRSLTCFCHIRSGSDITVQFQNRCCHCCGPLDTNRWNMIECLHSVNSIAMRLPCTDQNPSMERAWIELEGMEAIVKTASKAKFFIEFHSSCLEGMMSHHKDIFEFIKHYATQRQKFIHVFLLRDSTLKWEWHTGLWCSWISQARLVLQTTA